MLAQQPVAAGASVQHFHKLFAVSYHTWPRRTIRKLVELLFSCLLKRKQPTRSKKTYLPERRWTSVRSWRRQRLFHGPLRLRLLDRRQIRRCFLEASAAPLSDPSGRSWRASGDMDRCWRSGSLKRNELRRINTEFEEFTSRLIIWRRASIMCLIALVHIHLNKLIDEN